MNEALKYDHLKYKVTMIKGAVGYKPVLLKYKVVPIKKEKTPPSKKSGKQSDEVKESKDKNFAKTL